MSILDGISTSESDLGYSRKALKNKVFTPKYASASGPIQGLHLTLTGPAL